jgi:chromosomal replication initiator protein
MYLAREIIQSSYPDIARAFGKKDHSTVIHACGNVERTPELIAEAAVLRERLGG